MSIDSVAVLTKKWNNLLQRDFWDYYDQYCGFLYFFIGVAVVVFICILISHHYDTDRKKAIAEKKYNDRHCTVHLYGFPDLVVEKGEKPILSMPEKDGYAFHGWFLDSACTVPWVSSTPFTKDTILYPKWEKQ